VLVISKAALIHPGDASHPIFKPFAGLIKEEKSATTKALQTLVDSKL
jgi:hypothetical protein